MRKTIKYILILLLLGVVLSYFAYTGIYRANVPDNLAKSILYIQDGTDFQTLSNKLYQEGFIQNQSSFEWVSKLMKYSDGQIKAGRYKLEPGMHNRSLVSLLRSGRQEALDLTFNNVRTLDQLAGKLSAQLVHDSLSILTHLRDPKVQEKYGFNDETMITMFIPNTYKIYWNTPIPKFMDRMKKEHDKFWNEERRSQADALGLIPEQVYTLASIVEKETLAAKEKSKIAGLYLNRLNKNMLLQADPTVVYAVGDFEIRRVLNKHLELDSPYNTYKYTGLPPGPIYMPDISTIDATLSPEKHAYLFFCARPDNSGLHAFAKTNAQHEQNARKYHSWLNQNRIYR